MPAGARRTGSNEKGSEDPRRLVDMGEDGRGSVQYSFPTIFSAKTARQITRGQRPKCITLKKFENFRSCSSSRTTAWPCATTATPGGRSGASDGGRPVKSLRSRFRDQRAPIREKSRLFLKSDFDG